MREESSSALRGLFRSDVHGGTPSSTPAERPLDDLPPPPRLSTSSDREAQALESRESPRMGIRCKQLVLAWERSWASRK